MLFLYSEVLRHKVVVMDSKFIFAKPQTPFPYLAPSHTAPAGYDHGLDNDFTATSHQHEAAVFSVMNWVTIPTKIIADRQTDRFLLLKDY